MLLIHMPMKTMGYASVSPTSAEYN